MNATVRTLLLRQAGIISRAQAVGAGVTRRQVDRLLRDGEWLRVHPAVYRCAVVVPTPESAVRAAALWLGPGAVLSDEGAAWWWEMVPEAPATWRFVVSRRCVPQPGLCLSEGFVDPRDRTEHRDVSVLARPFALLRAAAVLEAAGAGRGVTLIDRAKQRRWTDVTELELAFDHHRGVPGTQMMRTLLDRTGDRAHSELERTAVRLLREAGVTGFVLNYRTTLGSGRAVELDLAFPDRRVAIELDGYAYHSGPEAHRADVQRANAILADGWTVRRFTWSDLLGDPAGFVRTVAEALAA